MTFRTAEIRSRTPSIRGERFRRTRAFTLIELLVVIAIIGVLSSVVLASLNSARSRAKDAAVTAQVIEFRKLMQLEYIDSGSYTNLLRGWIGGSNGITCDTASYSGTYANQATAICKAIQTNAGSGGSTGFFLTSAADSTFSVMARLQGGGVFCVGSSGRTSSGTGWNATTGWDGPGCQSNP